MIFVIFFIMALCLEFNALSMEESRIAETEGIRMQQLPAKQKPRIFELIESNASLKEIEEEINTGIDVNYEYGYSRPLIKAARTGREDLVRLLVSRGAEINKSAGADEQTPLIGAIRKNSYPVVALLLELGAHCNESKLCTQVPLHEALFLYSICCILGNYESSNKAGKIVNLLIEKGAVINWPSQYNQEVRKKYEGYIDQIQKEKRFMQIIIYQSPEVILFGNKN